MGAASAKQDSSAVGFENIRLSSKYDIRKYPQAVVAQTNATVSKSKIAFDVLSRYIGHNSQPANKTDQQFPLRVPVVNSDLKDAGDSKHYTLQFYLPGGLLLADAPEAYDTRVKIAEIPERYIAVLSYSGDYGHDLASRKLKKLHKLLLEDKIITPAADGHGFVSRQLNKLHNLLVEEKIIPTPPPAAAAAGESKEGESPAAAPPQEVDPATTLNWSVAYYHPPETWPAFRRNEIWVVLDPGASPVLQEFINEFDKAHAEKVNAEAVAADAKEQKEKCR